MAHPHVVGADEVEALSTDGLLAAVQHDPQVVLTVARRRLADTTGPTSEAITLWWVIGLAERERGDWAASRAALERALDLAGPGPDGELVARLATSLAFVVAHDGDFAGAMWLLDAAEGELRGRERAKLRAQRGVVRLRLGQLNEAVDDLTRAATALARNADAVGEARARVNLGAALTELGQYAGARRQLERAVRITATVDVDVVAANAHHNLAWVATIQGDTPLAIHHYLVAEQQYAATGAAAHLPRLYADHARALADANLLSDAARLVARALELARTTANVVVAADLGITAAEILLVQGDADGARRAAEESARLLREQGRLTWALMADRAALEARARGDDPGLADALVGNAEALIRHGWRAEALHELLLAADVELRAGRLDAASTLCARVGRQRRTVRQVDGILAARVEASLHEARHDRPAARRAVSRGLRRSAELQAGLGSMEVRAHAAAHGADLAELGARLAVADGRPMELLQRIEATRLITSRTPLVRPPDDESMATLLAELRQVTMALADPEQPPDRRATLEARRARVEDGVRRNGRMARVDGRPTGVNIRRELRSALTQLGTHQLLAHARLDDRLLAVTIAGGRSHLDDLGPIAPLRDLIDTIGFGLHRLNRTQGSPASRAAAVELVEAAARQLGDIVLPGAVRRQDSPLVVVPTGLLHGVAWRAIPQLAGREVVVSPSITAWATSAQRRVGRAVSRRVGFVAGPDLAHAAGEVQALARRYRDPIVAVGADATSERLRALLGSCDLVHIACHGAFRADNPLFSTLRLVDGPMNVYDLERARRMPRTVVLSACSVGSSATLHGDRLLGVASALIDLGAASIVAPLSPVDDAATPAVMATLHLHLSAGLAPARALARLTAGATDPTAAAFIALGA